MTVRVPVGFLVKVGFEFAVYGNLLASFYVVSVARQFNRRLSAGGVTKKYERA